MLNKAAVCVLLVKGNDFLAVSLKEDHSDLNLPGGKVERKETFLDCAVRETKEETGLDIYASELNFLHDDYEEDWYVITYWTDKYAGDIYTEENHVVKWAPLEDLKNSKKWPKYNTEVFDKYIKISK